LIAAHGQGRAVFDRTLLLLAIAVFVELFQWIYRSWIHPTYPQLGFDVRTLSVPAFCLVFILSTIPGLWMPRVLEGPSDFLYWSTYLTVFIPSMFVPFCVKLRPPAELWQLVAAFFGGLALLRCYRIGPAWELPRLRLSPRTFWLGFGVAGGALFAAVLRIYWGHFQLVPFGSVYEGLRESGGARLQETYVGYAVGLLANAINPFLMTQSLFRGGWALFALGAAGQLLLYSTAGARSILLSVAVIPAVYWIVRRPAGFGLRMVLSLSVACLALVIAVGLPVESARKSFRVPTSLLLMRSLGIPGLLTAQYQAFFAVHPVTHLSHAHGVSWFVKYPYARPLGVEVNQWTTGNPGGNANASFWSTDGIAGFGIPGLLVAGLLAGLVFWCLDRSTPRGGGPFAAVLCSGAAISLGNTSLFTTLLTGGLASIMLILWLVPRELVCEPAPS
jgi:hypothetical protein